MAVSVARVAAVTSSATAPAATAARAASSAPPACAHRDDSVSAATATSTAASDGASKALPPTVCAPASSAMRGVVTPSDCHTTAARRHCVGPPRMPPADTDSVGHAAAAAATHDAGSVTDAGADGAVGTDDRIASGRGAAAAAARACTVTALAPPPAAAASVAVGAAAPVAATSTASGGAAYMEERHHRRCDSRACMERSPSAAPARAREPHDVAIRSR